MLNCDQTSHYTRLKPGSNVHYTAHPNSSNYFWKQEGMNSKPNSTYEYRFNNGINEAATTLFKVKSHNACRNLNSLMSPFNISMLKTTERKVTCSKISMLKTTGRKVNFTPRIYSVHHQHFHKICFIIYTHTPKHTHIYICIGDNKFVLVYICWRQQGGK